MNLSENSVVELTQALVQQETVNPPGNEEPAMRLLGDHLEAHGASVSYQRVADSRVNLVARCGQVDGKSTLVLSGHMDVVPPGAARWTHPPFTAEIENGQMFGRGTVDMKGGVAAMATAFLGLSTEHLEGTLVLAISAGEENGMVGARLMADSTILGRPDGVVVGEPTGLDVFIAEKGVLWLRVTARGRTAHGSMPALGLNAVTFLSHAVTQLSIDQFEFEKSPLLGSPSLSPNMFNGGSANNVVPDHAELILDIRTVPGQSSRAVIDRLGPFLTQVRDVSGIECGWEIETLQDVPAVESDAGSRLEKCAVSAVRDITGREPPVGGVSYGTDGAILASAAGADLVILGPGDPAQAHQPDEHISIDELVTAVDVYANLVRGFFSG
jgi:succinyl-diaminopimelate desuccinylase